MEEVIHTSFNAAAPQGSDFHVEQGPFRPGKGISLTEHHFDPELNEYVFIDWPMLYILTSEDAAYIGQTHSVKERMGQHAKDPEKQSFTTANIIYHPEFNHSVLDQYEHQLIEYMNADGRYSITNKNSALHDSNYFSKAAYSAMFEDLWERLRELNLTEHTLASIEESEVFKYSPFKVLNVDQRIALDEIITAVSMGLESAEPIIVEGMPGTGKTVLAIYLLKLLKDDPKYRGLNIRLLEPVTSLRGTLKNALKTVVGLSPEDVIGPSDLSKASRGFRRGAKGFDILLVDEAHKLKRRQNIQNYGTFDATTRALGLEVGATQLDWVLSQVKLPIFFFDPLQVIGPSGISEGLLAEALGPRLGSPIKLASQMRVRGGDDYLEYVKALLFSQGTALRTFEDYDLKLHRGFESFCGSFEECLASHSLTRMIAGYAWPWTTKKKKRAEFPDLFDISIDGIELRWNFQLDNWVGAGLEDDFVAHEVGCIHSIQGYDLSYAYVIIGNDLRYDEDSHQLIVDKASYFDTNGKNKASAEELAAYIRNIYYVLLTRGIYGTHLYVCDDALRRYLAEYIPTVD